MHMKVCGSVGSPRIFAALKNSAHSCAEFSQSCAALGLLLGMPATLELSVRREVLSLTSSLCRHSSFSL